MELCFCPRFFGQRRQISHLLPNIVFDSIVKNCQANFIALVTEIIYIYIYMMAPYDFDYTAENLIFRFFKSLFVILLDFDYNYIGRYITNISPDS